VTDTDPTPERRWRAVPILGTGWVAIEKDGIERFRTVWEPDELAATLNEADKLRERVRVLEARLEVAETTLAEIEEHVGPPVNNGLSWASMTGAVANAVGRWRALAGAETPAPLRVCDACGLTSADPTWNDCAPGFEDMHLIQGPVPDYCGPVRAGADGGERRGG
jgi:hypothetical protein